jgi:hypothetical protein
VRFTATIYAWFVKRNFIFNLSKKTHKSQSKDVFLPIKNWNNCNFPIFRYYFFVLQSRKTKKIKNKNKKYEFYADHISIMNSNLIHFMETKRKKFQNSIRNTDISFFIAMLAFNAKKHSLLPDCDNSAREHGNNNNENFY